MSEEIIINGKKITELSDMFFEYCELEKEMERLQEENKELKFTLDMFNKLCKKINVENIEKSFNTYIEYTKNLKEENEELKKKKDEYYLRTLDYEAKISYLIQALEEIRKIAKFNQFYNPEKLLINGYIGRFQNLKMTEIYNKTNEVLNDRD